MWDRVGPCGTRGTIRVRPSGSRHVRRTVGNDGRNGRYHAVPTMVNGRARPGACEVAVVTGLGRRRGLFVG